MSSENSPLAKLIAYAMIALSVAATLRPTLLADLARIDWSAILRPSDDSGGSGGGGGGDALPDFEPVKGDVYEAWRGAKFKRDAIEQAMFWRQAADIVLANEPTLGEVVKFVSAAGEIASADRGRTINEANPKGAKAIAAAFEQFGEARDYTPKKWAAVATDVADQLLTAGTER